MLFLTVAVSQNLFPLAWKAFALLTQNFLPLAINGDETFGLSKHFAMSIDGRLGLKFQRRRKIFSRSAKQKLLIFSFYS